MEKATVNGITGKIIELKRDLPNIGLGPATAHAGYEFVPDAPPPAATYEFEKLRSVTLGGKRKDCYRVIKIIGGSRIVAGEFTAPARTPRSKLLEIYHAA